MFNSPVLGRGKIKPIDVLKAIQKGRTHYQVYWQQRDLPDRELAHDPRKTLRSIHYSVSGSAGKGEGWRPFLEPGETVLDTCTDPKELPSWMSARALDYYADQYTRTGFTGMLNYYRCRDRNWEISSFLDGAVIRQPSMFGGGAADAQLEFLQGAYDQLETYLVGLRKKLLLPGVGHDAPEEAPDTVNELLLEFLEQLDHA
jgi:pimeloyl-ACP methyl ester carboxylesterase